MTPRLIALVVLSLSAALAPEAQAGCPVLDSAGAPAAMRSDALAAALAAPGPCPLDAFAFRGRLAALGLALETAMVANRGFHNPSQGSFSLFETAVGRVSGTSLAVGPGELFFGHFIVAADGQTLVGDQSPAEGSLMIEAFAWDARKGYYNFYELRGTGAKGQWFYRGDSADILADSGLLHRQPDPSAPRFGNRLRCSGCHSQGGPIMKELAPPHNDWWEPLRALDLGGRVPEPRLQPLLRGLIPSDRFSRHVLAGAEKLASSPALRAARAQTSLQERLRPLFCPVELNLESDLVPAGHAEGGAVAVPLEFFADPRLVAPADRAPLPVGRQDYDEALSWAGARFPETELADADHAWLTPVKAVSDKLAVDALINDGLIDRAFAAAVLAVDFTSPLFSADRCGLLRLVPESADGDWKVAFLANLSADGRPAARELIANLVDPSRGREAIAAEARAFLAACRVELAGVAGVRGLFALLAQRRVEAFASEISKNPRGQILEPGFRVIFPEASSLDPRPGALRLTRDCRVIGGG